MKLNVTQEVCGLDNEPLKDDEGVILTLRPVCVNALMASLETDRHQSGEDKLKAWLLAQRLYKEDEPDLKPEELTALKDRVGQCYGAGVVGPVFMILDGQ